MLPTSYSLQPEVDASLSIQVNVDKCVGRIIERNSIIVTYTIIHYILPIVEEVVSLVSNTTNFSYISLL